MVALRLHYVCGLFLGNKEVTAKSYNLTNLTRLASGNTFQFNQHRFE